MKRAADYFAICVICVALVAGCRPTTLPEDRARLLLRDIRDAQRSLSVSGRIHTKIRLGENLVSAHGRIHRGEGRMRLDFTSGRAEGARIIQQKGSVWQISPNGETVRRLPHNPVETPLRFGRNVKVTTRPGGRIAGRGTKKVVVTPARDIGGRIEMWVDRRSDFPLRMDRYNSRGQLVSSTRYEKVDFSAGPPKVAQLPEDTQPAGRGRAVRPIDEDRAADVLGREPIEPTYIPEGFEFIGYYLHTSPRREAVVVRYSDGLHPLNILQMRTARLRPSQEGPPGRRGPRAAGPRGESNAPGRAPMGQRRGRSGHGPPAANDRPPEPSTPPHDPGMDTGDMHRPQMHRHRMFGHIIRFRRGELTIAVQGEVPPKQLRRIAAGLQEDGIDF